MKNLSDPGVGPSPAPIVELRGIRVERAKVEVLNIPSLKIGGGEVISLIGPNGAGKSTLLKTLCCLMRPREGSILFKGLEVGKDLSVFDYRRQVTMVFQEPLLFDTTVFANVASGLKFRGIGKAEIEERVTENLRLFGIEHLKDRSARKVSGGEAQRVSLARAFAVKPEVLALDEPFSALDPPTREGLVRDLDIVLKRTNATAIFATHDRVEALQLSHRIAVMNQGTILQIAPPEEVMGHPIDAFIAAFVGVETILGAVVETAGEGTFTARVGDRSVVALGGATPGERVFFCIRPENVTLLPESADQPTSARNSFRGRITRIIPMGPYLKVMVDCGFPLTAYVTKASVENLTLGEGVGVTASFKATAVHVVKR